MRWVRAAGWLLVGSVLLFVGLLTFGPRVPDRVDPVFDLGEVRALAGEDGPVTLRAARVVAGIQPGLLLRVGGDLARRPLPVYPLRLQWPDGRSMLIEPATDDECSKGRLPLSAFDPDAYARMQEAMREAFAIVATHEHFDHPCGLTRSPHFDELADRAILTEAQLNGHTYMSEVTDRVREAVEPLQVTEGIARIAPGVVLIEAPGHTPGSVWIYVRQRTGAEWLLVGDSVWTAESITEGRAKPFLTATGGENPWVHAGQIRALMTLTAEHPELRVLVAHDDAQWRDALDSGAILPL